MRIVHLGLSAFHRAHQAWYTAQVDNTREWGIAAFTGRHPDAAHTLAARDGRYVVIERSDAADTFATVGHLIAARDGADRASLRAFLQDPVVAIVTITVTESGYGLNASGTLDMGAPHIAADLEHVRASMRGEHDDTTALSSTIGRLVDGLAARRSHRAGPLAVLPCDNLPSNGELVRRAVRDFATAADEQLARWIESNVSFVSTSVDRITPRTRPEDIDLVERKTGFRDEGVVVTEPHHNWILAGQFPAGRPEWERAGAQFVEDIRPFENRKLWMLNGAHSLLAYAGTIRGHETVDQAIADPVLLRQVNFLWNLAGRHLPQQGLALPRYRAELLERFQNRRIRHGLRQIAADGTLKLRSRTVPLVVAELQAGRDANAALRVVAAWVDYQHAAPGNSESDAEALRIREALNKTSSEQLPALLEILEPSWRHNPDVHRRVQMLRAL
ncbi:mannitol dehydrogenase family protein [Microbacterium sp. EST19A]|uniref:mannitol dehydrogenase family protein n=1 Tax=Microbacterium sp. EST19A TaxID=2862681 RepID=UPI001CBDDB99|nr:mannitol dehydrogenase family protein [Microbacterium sp. EST19A]